MHTHYLSRLSLVCFLLSGWFTASTVCGAEEFLPELTAFKVSSAQVRPGESISINYEFCNAGKAAAAVEYGIFVHVRPAAPGDPDVMPGCSGDFFPLVPTFAWLPNTKIQEDNHPVLIPKELPPGRYSILIGFFDPESGERRKMANDALAASGLRYRVATVEVVASGAAIASKPVEVRYRDTKELPYAEEKLSRSTSEDVFVLGRGKLLVILGAERPVVTEYQSETGLKLLGDSIGYPLRARIRRLADGRYSTICLCDPSCFSRTMEGEEARYSTKVSDNGKPAASFDVVFRVNDPVLRVSIEQVKEETGYQLIDVFLPQIVSAQGCGEQQTVFGGQLILPTQSGRLIHLDHASSGCHRIGLNWMESDLCGAVVGERGAAAIRTRDWDNELEARVSRIAGGFVGGYAVRMCLRVKSDHAGTDIRLSQSPSVEVAVLWPSEEKKRVGWVDAAKWLRQDVKGSPNPLYGDTFIYKIFCDSPGMTDYTTFDDALEIVRKVHQLAPWMKQVVYLVGWQYQGHDTGYPATDKINERLGGMKALKRITAEAAKLNALISFHDNFDDAYRDSPQWDESVIARDCAGEPMKGGVWAGGQSYILAFQKYAKKAGLERVRRTVAQLSIRDSYHIDVLSAVPLRRDFNVQSPENSMDSLAGKMAIIKQFNQLGVDVTSEGFTAPFVGVIGHAWRIWNENDVLFPKEEPIPFIPMIYHGGPTTYARGNPSASYARDNVLYGAAYATDFTKQVDIHDLAEPLYLVVAPWTYLRDRKMSDYERYGELRKVVYDKNTFVETNEKTGQWRIVIDGETVIENDLVVIRKKDFLAVYAQTARRATVSLPESWRGKAWKASNACTGAAVVPKNDAAAQAVTLDLAAREPILLHLDATPQQ